MTDPNADLIGFEFEAERLGTVMVLGSTAWNPAYVEISNEQGEGSVRVASQVRHSRMLREADHA